MSAYLAVRKRFRSIFAMGRTKNGPVIREVEVSKPKMAVDTGSRSFYTARCFKFNLWVKINIPDTKPCEDFNCDDPGRATRLLILIAQSTLGKNKKIFLILNYVTILNVVIPAGPQGL